MPTVPTKLDMLIGGKKCQAASGKTTEILNPATNEVLAEIPAGDVCDAEAAIDAAAEANASREWRDMMPTDRGSLVLKAADILESRLQEFAIAETNDVGKPIAESEAFDVPMAIDHLRYYGKLAVDLVGETIPTLGTIHDYTVREPIGVVGEIIPWNFPLVIACRKLGPSLVAGNCVVMKPSTWAPVTTMMLADVFLEAGFPAGVVNIISGAGSKVGDAMTNSAKVGKLSFTGSTEVGCTIMECASAGVRGVDLELGGKGPAVVFADADIDQAVAGILFGAFLNQGECCCAATRVCIDSSIHDVFVEKLVAKAKTIKVGDPMDPYVRMGPLVHPTHFDTVVDYIRSGIESGAKLLTGGADRPAGLEQGNYLPITIFDEVATDSRIYREEIFGPVLTVTAFDGGREALIDAANDTDYGLAGSVWTRDLNTAHYAARKIDCGTVWINVHNFVFSQAPYGGYKLSGLGREMGREGLLAYTETKNVLAWIGDEPFTWY